MKEVLTGILMFWGLNMGITKNYPSISDTMVMLISIGGGLVMMTLVFITPYIVNKLPNKSSGEK